MFKRIHDQNLSRVYFSSVDEGKMCGVGSVASFYSNEELKSISGLA